MFKNHQKVSLEFYIQNDNFSISSNIWIFQAKISLIKLSNETFWVILKHCECLEETKKKNLKFHQMIKIDQWQNWLCPKGMKIRFLSQ